MLLPYWAIDLIAISYCIFGWFGSPWVIEVMSQVDESTKNEYLQDFLTSNDTFDAVWWMRSCFFGFAVCLYEYPEVAVPLSILISAFYIFITIYFVFGITANLMTEIND
jgi:hypothetical protein